MTYKNEEAALSLAVFNCKLFLHPIEMEGLEMLR